MAAGFGIQGVLEPILCTDTKGPSFSLSIRLMPLLAGKIQGMADHGITCDLSERSYHSTDGPGTKANGGTQRQGWDEGESQMGEYGQLGASHPCCSKVTCSQ